MTTRIILTAINQPDSNKYIINSLNNSLFDACYILDFQSTNDNTREILEKCIDRNIKFEIDSRDKISFSEAKKFIFENCKAMCAEMKWELKNTYIFLLDSHIQVNTDLSQFDKKNLTECQYGILEKINNDEYYNVRLLRLDCEINFSYDFDFYFIMTNDNDYDIQTIDKNVLSCSRTDSISEQQKDLSEKIQNISQLIDFKNNIDIETKLNSLKTKQEYNNLLVYLFLSKLYNNNNIDNVDNVDNNNNNDIGNLFIKHLSFLSFERQLFNFEKTNLLYYVNYLYISFLLNKNDLTNAMKECIICDNNDSSRFDHYYKIIAYCDKNKQYDLCFKYYKISNGIIENNNKTINKRTKKLFSNLNLISELEYQYTLFIFYIKDADKKDVIKKMVSLMNTNIPQFDNMFNNMKYYQIPKANVGYSSFQYIFPKINGYNHSSCCIVPITDGLMIEINKYLNNNNNNNNNSERKNLISEKAKYLINIRYVNYYVDPKTGYCESISGEVINTINKFAFLDSSLKEVIDNFYIEWNQDFSISKLPTNIRGLEDVRLVNFNSQLMFTATQKEYSSKIRVAFGKIDLATMQANGIVMNPPTDTDCEKNWLPFIHNNKVNFIYKFHPLEVGVINPNNNKLIIHTRIKTPKFWSRMRGSSCPIISIHNKNELWMLTHMVEYSSPRKYYHCVVVLNSETLQPIKYSLPMCFLWTGVEYALTMLMIEHNLQIVFSKFDCESHLITIPITNLEFMIC